MRQMKPETGKPAMIDIVEVSVQYHDEIYYVRAHDADGREYTHHHLFTEAPKAFALLYRVLEACRINPEHWHCRVPYGTDAWLIDGMEVTLMDDEERHRKGM